MKVFSESIISEMKPTANTFMKNALDDYLFDSFNCNENQLSYNRAGYINNNYPSPIHHYAGQLVSDYYIYKDYMVYTSIDD